MPEATPREVREKSEFKAAEDMAMRTYKISKILRKIDGLFVKSNVSIEDAGTVFTNGLGNFILRFARDKEHKGRMVKAALDNIQDYIKTNEGKVQSLVRKKQG